VLLLSVVGVGIGVGVRHHRRHRRRHYDNRYGVKDNKGKEYWKIRNETENSIQAMSDSDSVNIRSNKTKRLYRAESFKIKIKNKKTGKMTEIETQDHRVTIN